MLSMASLSPQKTIFFRRHKIDATGTRDNRLTKKKCSFCRQTKNDTKLTHSQLNWSEIIIIILKVEVGFSTRQNWVRRFLSSVFLPLFLCPPCTILLAQLYHNHNHNEIHSLARIHTNPFDTYTYCMGYKEKQWPANWSWLHAECLFSDRQLQFWHIFLFKFRTHFFFFIIY